MSKTISSLSRKNNKQRKRASYNSEKVFEDHAKLDMGFVDKHQIGGQFDEIFPFRRAESAKIHDLTLLFVCQN